mgnify:CR=1 FL=1
MELFSMPWWSALLAIILIDLVLAGDNAIVIALAARNLPPEHQNKAIMWGTVGAIAVRSAMTETPNSQQLIADLASLTGADVAASTDLTGDSPSLRDNSERDAMFDGGAIAATSLANG